MSIASQAAEIIENDIYGFVGEYYDVSVKSEDGTIASIVVSVKPKDQDMPDFSIQTVMGSTDNAVVFEPTLQFPDLTFDGEANYADDIHYIIGKWYDLANGITQLNKYEFNVDDYELNEE